MSTPGADVFDPMTASDAEKLREAVKWFDTWDKLAEVMHVEEHDTKARFVVADLTRGTELQADLLRIAERLERLDATETVACEGCQAALDPDACHYDVEMCALCDECWAELP